MAERANHLSTTGSPSAIPQQTRRNQPLRPHERHANDSFYRAKRFMAPAVLKVTRS